VRLPTFRSQSQTITTMSANRAPILESNAAEEAFTFLDSSDRRLPAISFSSSLSVCEQRLTTTSDV
jgi:hypothetical protein